MSPGVEHYLIVSAILFTLGTLGVLLRRDPLIIFMSIELIRCLFPLSELG